MKAAALLASIGSAAAFHEKAAPVNGDIIPNQYIVTLKPEAALDKSLAGLLGKSALDKVERIYGNYEGASFKGFSLKDCNEKTAISIADMDEVLSIEPNQMAHAFAVQENPTWGLDRVDQESSTLDNLYYYKNAAGSGVDVYTLDTGIRYSHSDFEGRATFGYSAWDDDGDDRNGHGTHCASTMAGAEWGVAKKANLISVKVLSDSGSGSTDGIIAGVVYTNRQPSARTKVANMSLGGGRSRALNAAVDAAADTINVVASGNSNRDACTFSPASADKAYAVNAMQQGDSRSSFSNFGTCTDIFAPGTSITAAWINSDSSTNTISGTSMAAPHVAGVAALLLSDSASLTVDQVKATMNGLATPNAISNAGTGSPNLLVYNDRDGPPTPAPPTPAPPPTPATMCDNNACFFSFDIDCDDGGIGADYSFCSHGTDCFDCCIKTPSRPDCSVSS